ncbi:WAT1-related protein At2g37450 isoform X2 [Helianthus annuus]|uniref:WAT1-related protein At2g37450 isoform X2 n=1 Tax=Helianthus annuus TaxID=4232 RepID=UPI000B8F38CC|nr:WAT1-related protein At2g37450 isoform X2 [Helianthus annuus]
MASIGLGRAGSCYSSSEDRISSKMGEGTFGQVLECLDNEKKEPVAIKAVRSINKYREAAMIEMDVLQTLASHDVGGSRNSWRNMTVSIFIKLMILALLEPVIGQNLYILGMRATTATFTVSMSNVLPAWILRLEVVNLKSIRSQAKVAGTLTTAMIMTLVKGPLLELFWTKGRTNKKEEMHNGVDLQLSLKGAIMIVIGCFGWSCFVILQAITLKSYPDELAMTAWICLLATIEGAIATLIMERGNPAVWAIICSGAVYYVQGSIMRERGPVFVTAFNPLCMIVVAVTGSIFLAEKTYLGRRVLGAVVIVVGLYMVDWGKSKDQEHKDPSLSMDEHTTPENQILGEESKTNCNDQVIAIKTSDEICDEHDEIQPADV